MAARHSFILPEEMRIPNINTSLEWEFNQNCKNLANKMNGPFLMGDKITIPDILLTTLLRWAKNIGFNHGEKKLDNYLKVMKNRDAFKNVKPL